MQAEVVTITPDMASEMLKGNVRNRPLNRNRVTQIANAIKRGEWELNGETIIMNGTRLLNGQHRLTACVLAEMPIQTLVVRGASESSFHTIDTGVSRSAGDVLAMAGVPNARNVAASLRWVHNYNNSRIGLKIVYTIPQIEQMLADYPGVVSSVALTKSGRIANPALLGAAHYLFFQIDPDAASAFVKQINGGVDLSAGDGLFILRERLIADKISKSTLSEEYKFALMIKAWNARREGAIVRRLTWREGGHVPEAFPTIK